MKEGKMKGQYFSFDAIIASVIFILTVFSLVSYWHSVRSTLAYQSNEAGKDAIRISEQLFLEPVSGDCVERFGFATSDGRRILNSTLLSNCGGLDDMKMREKFSTPYNVSIYINSEGEGCESKYVIGPKILDEVENNKNSALKSLLKLRRIAPIQCETNFALATVDIYVYE